MDQVSEKNPYNTLYYIITPSTTLITDNRNNHTNTLHINQQVTHRLMK